MRKVRFAEDQRTKTHTRFFTKKTRDIWKTFFFSVTMKFPGNLRYFNVHSIVWEEPR